LCCAQFGNSPANSGAGIASFDAPMVPRYSVAVDSVCVLWPVVITVDSRQNAMLLVEEIGHSYYKWIAEV